MEIKEIYDMLNNGWVYIIQNENEFFKRMFLELLDKEDIKNIDNKIFIRKTDKLYNILKDLGMDVSLYDSLIAMAFNVYRNTLKFNLYALKNSKDADVKLQEISQKIKENNFEKQLNTIF